MNWKGGVMPLACSLAICALTAAAATAASSGTPPASAHDLSCADAYEVDTSVGRLTNNVWNKQAAGGAPYRQCLRYRGEPPAREYGWSWSWPAEGDVLLAFPQTVFGWKPWNGGTSTTPKLPIRIDRIHALRLTYTVETVATGKHNLSMALWLTRSGQTGAEPNPADISADINIWTGGFDFDPSGERIGQATIGGVTFEVWHARDMGDASAASSYRWTHIVYRSTTPHTSISLDVKAFLEDALARELISPSHYVSSIELGNEVMTGTGETWIKHLSLEIE